MALFMDGGPPLFEKRSLKNADNTATRLWGFPTGRCWGQMALVYVEFKRKSDKVKK
jgi:hypothetical protein